MPVGLVACSISVAGLVLLLLLGLRVRYHGDEPHCRKCRYNLTALVSDRCPECGTKLAPYMILPGRPARRPMLAVLGVAGLGLAALVAFSPLRNVDWYQHYPTSWVIGDLRSADSRTAWRARDELDRRGGVARLSDADRKKLFQVAMAAIGPSAKSPIRWHLSSVLREMYPDKLSVSQRQRLSDAALKALASSPEVLVQRDLFAVVTRMHVNGELSAEQVKTLFEQVLAYRFAVRSRVAMGDPVPWEVTNPLEHSTWGRNVGGGWSTIEYWADLHLDRVWIDEHDVSGTVQFREESPQANLRGSFPVSTPGHHTIRLELTASILHLPWEGPEAVARMLSEGRPCYTKRLSMQGRFEVVETAPSALGEAQ